MKFYAQESPVCLIEVEAQLVWLCGERDGELLGDVLRSCTNTMDLRVGRGESSGQGQADGAFRIIVTASVPAKRRDDVSGWVDMFQRYHRMTIERRLSKPDEELHGIFDMDQMQQIIVRCLTGLPI